MPNSPVGRYCRPFLNTARLRLPSTLGGVNLAVLCVVTGKLLTAGTLAGCGERAPAPNARDVLNKNEQSISESLDKFQVDQDERDKPIDLGTPVRSNVPAIIPVSTTPTPPAPPVKPGQ